MTRSIILILLILIGGTVSAQFSSVSPTNSYHFSPSDSAKVSGSPVRHGNSLHISAIVPISLVATGVIVESLPSNTVFSKERIQQHVQGKVNGFRTTVDNYLQFIPVAAMFGLKLAGVKGKSDFLNQAIITAKSELLVTAIVFSMKHFIHDMRPDGSADNSMPSGHTAQAFASATLLDMEYRDTSPWISVGGYLCATATGFFRVANNRHWASDVLVGAGIGIASVKLVYLTHRYKWGKMPTAVLVPTIYQNGGGVAFAMKF
ncbi:MAG: phosphatase PAP2 family protein [Prolixibacteraceae bacterium]|jgi:membrane-associated phospholipid phosphatase|nr:phosphatase PAP2 family protein [Prolixibacteraceae bacterium]